MLWTITIVLFILWLVGLVSSYTMGGWIHILLVLAIIVLIFNLLSGRRAVCNRQAYASQQRIALWSESHRHFSADTPKVPVMPGTFSLHQITLLRSTL